MGTTDRLAVTGCSDCARGKIKGSCPLSVSAVRTKYGRESQEKGGKRYTSNPPGSRSGHDSVFSFFEFHVGILLSRQALSCRVDAGTVTVCVVR